MKANSRTKEWPIPAHFNPDRVGEVWKVPYQERAEEAERWAREHRIRPAIDDQFRICLMLPILTPVDGEQ